MTREEQIMNDPAAAAYCDPSRGWIHEAFKDGVDWADKTMIEKAIEWLKVNIPKRVINISTEDEFKIMIGSKTWDDFKKAMEE